MKIEYSFLLLCNVFYTCFYYFILSVIYQKITKIRTIHCMFIFPIYQSKFTSFVKERGWYVIIIISNQKALWVFRLALYDNNKKKVLKIDDVLWEIGKNDLLSSELNTFNCFSFFILIEGYSHIWNPSL